MNKTINTDWFLAFYSKKVRRKFNQPKRSYKETNLKLRRSTVAPEPNPTRPRYDPFASALARRTAEAFLLLFFTTYTPVCVRGSFYAHCLNKQVYFVRVVESFMCLCHVPCTKLYHCWKCPFCCLSRR